MINVPVNIITAFISVRKKILLLLNTETEKLYKPWVWLPGLRALFLWLLDHGLCFYEHMWAGVA